jgi:hypothetical protein
MNEFERSAIRITKVKSWAVDCAAVTIFLKKNIDALSLQELLCGFILVTIDHEGVMHPIGHLSRSLLDWSVTLDQQDTNSTRIQEGDALVRQR